MDIRGAVRRLACRTGSARVRVEEERAQGTVEYALVMAALLAIVVACAALWRAGEDGVLAQAAVDAVSHELSATGAQDITLY